MSIRILGDQALAQLAARGVVPNAALLQAVMRQDLFSFVRKAFSTLNPGVAFADNWHMRSIAYHLELVRTGALKRLVIAMPPRSLKSIMASVAFPAYVHGLDPTKQLICVSYGQELSTKLGNDYRALLSSSWYRALFPGTRISKWKDTESEVLLTERGTRVATSIGGALTGRGADIVIIDDPLKPADAMSEPKRTAVNEWFGSTLLSRLNDKKNGAIVIVTQRVHADDLVGHVLERSGDDWTVLSLPAIALADEEIPIGAGKTYFRRADEVLHPAREPRELLDRMRRELGSEAFAAQYQQTPVPAGGNLFRREWIRYYDEAPTRDKSTRVIQSWDTASKTEAQNDFSVGTTWAYKEGKYYLLDVIRGKYEFPDLKAKALNAARAWKPSRVLIEDAGVGAGLIAELKREGVSAIGVRPENSKLARASVQTAKFEAGQVLLPRRAPWLSDLQAELLAFPAGRHDDQVDSIVQMLADKINTVVFTIIGPRGRMTTRI